MPYHSVVLPGLVGLLLLGCGGGGADMAPPVTDPGPSPGASPPPAQPPQETDPLDVISRAEFQTPEYRNNANEVVDAAAAYVRGGTGLGVTLAVVDGEIVPTHFDLDDRVVDVRRYGSGPHDRDHAMGVAGVALAERNLRGIHGVAYESGLVNYAIVAEDGVIPQDGRVPAALRDAANGPAAVINNSWGSIGGSLPGAHREAMRAVADRGKVAVWAAGNGSTPDRRLAPTPQAMAPATDRALEPAWIAVVSYNPATGGLSDFSAMCGDAAPWCVAAPGDRVISLVSDPAKLATWSGTSFAAPVVTGSLALLLDRFPGLTPREAREILLRTAVDLGDPGPDPLYGRGLIDLERATRPVGAMSVPTGASVGDGAAPLEESRLAAGPALGDGPARGLDGMDVAALDAYRRAYRVSFADGTATATGRHAGASLLDDYGTPPLAPLEGADAASDEAVFRLRRVDGALVTARVESGALAAPPVAALAALSPRPARVLPQDAGNPFLGIVDSGVRLTLASGGRGLTTAWREDGMATAYEQAVPLGGGSARLAAGVLLEEDAALGTTGSGALDLAGGRTATGFLSAGLRVELGPNVSLSVAGHLGASRMLGATAGIVDGFSAVGTAAGAELAWRTPAGPGTMLTLRAWQPLRVERGAFALTVPVARDAEGRLAQEERIVPAVPSGREVGLELGWSMPVLDDGARLDASLVHRLDADHVDGADRTAVLVLFRAPL